MQNVLVSVFEVESEGFQAITELKKMFPLYPRLCW